MKILERYVLAEFAKLLAITLLAFILLFLMVDLFENMDSLMKYKVPAWPSIMFFAYKLPFIVSQVFPIAVLMAVLLSLGILSKHGEITSMKAGGVSLLRVVAPLLAAGILISLVVIVMNESVTPPALKKIDAFKKQWFGIQGSSFGQEGVWIRAGHGIFNIIHVDARKKELQGLTYYSIDKPFEVKNRLQARLVEWKDDRWVAPEATVWTFTAEGKAIESNVKDVPFDELAPQEDLANFENFQKNMSFYELKEYVKVLEADGYEATKYKIDLYGRIAFPLINFIMVLVGIPFALKTGRHAGVATGVGISIVIAFSYWVVFALTRSLGQNGIIPPMFAAAFPDILFFAIGAFMFGFVKQ